MKKILFAILILVILIFPAAVFADSGTGETVTIPKDMLTDQQKAELEKQDIQNKISTYGTWVGLGKEIGTAIDSSLGALTNRANEFANTKVGMFTMFIVAYKVIGTDLIQLIIGLPLFVFGFIIWLIMFSKNCIYKPKLLVCVEGPFWARKKTYQDNNDRRDYANWQWGYIFVLACLIGTCALIIFL